MEVVVGIDVAKSSLVACMQSRAKILARREFKNDGQGRRELLVWAKEKAGKQSYALCMESTGGYEFAMACLGVVSGLTVFVENPYRIKRYGQARGYQNKNDKSDARTIADYALRMEPRPWKMAGAHMRELTMLNRHRENLLGERNRFGNRLEHAEAMAKLELKHTKAQIEFINIQLGEIEAQMQDLLSRHEQLELEIRALEGIHGIGRVTARTVILEMPDIEDFEDAKQWAAQAGGYPMQNESGLFRGPSHMCRAGNSRVRRALYMPVTVAKLCNPAIQEFAIRLAAKGKKPKQVRIACMRKLLLLCFGVLKEIRAGREPVYGQKIPIQRKKKAIAT